MNTKILATALFLCTFGAMMWNHKYHEELKVTAALTEEKDTLWEIREDLEKSIEAVCDSSTREQIIEYYTNLQVKRSKRKR